MGWDGGGWLLTAMGEDASWGWVGEGGEGLCIANREGAKRNEVRWGGGWRGEGIKQGSK
jgi:hypothetical protein